MDPKEEEDRLPPPRCCPICGHTFYDYAPKVVCPTEHYGQQEFDWSETIHEDADYLWVE